MGFFGASSSSGDRTGIMMKEATQFLKNLQRAEKDLRTLHKTVDVTLAGCKQVMDAPLPHVFEETAAGGGAAVKAVESIGGPGFSAEQVSRVNVELGQKMQTQVFAPLQQWISNYNDAAAKQKVVDKLKAEMEARIKKVNGLKVKLDATRAKGGEGNPKVADKVEEQTKVLQHKEAKLSIATQNYQQEEAQQHQKLSILIKDAAYLRVFIKTALALEGQALVGASEAMLVFLPDPQAQPPQPAPAAAPMQPAPGGMPHAATMQHSATMHQAQPTMVQHAPTMQHQATMPGGHIQAWGSMDAPPAAGPTRGSSLDSASGAPAPAYPSGVSYGRTATLSHPNTP